MPYVILLLFRLGNVKIFPHRLSREEAVQAAPSRAPAVISYERSRAL